MIEVSEVSSKRDLKRFILLPFRIYRDDPFYSPELVRDQLHHFSEKNPFLKRARVRFFIALKDGEPAGRVTSIINPAHNDYHNDRTGFFGFFESINDHDVAHALLNRVASELKEAGMEIMRGPMNFSTNEQCGFLLEGYNDPPMLMTPYNPSYYNDLMEACGLVKSKDLLAFIKYIPEELPEKIYRAAAIAEKRGIRVRKADKKRLGDEMMIFKEIYNEAWKNNWGFIPFSDEEIQYIVKRLKPIIDTDLTLIAEKDGIPVGFLGIFPDFNLVLRKMKGKLTPLGIIRAIYYSKRIEDLRLLLLGVRPEYRLKGVDALLFREGFKGARRFRRVEFSWILEDNLPVINLVEMIGGRLYKRYRIYEKTL
ncbi:MAG TPA: hypothetical protein ENK09_08445 [Nitrospirae bacterium]|nr:hypothetical protein [Nitrospirota bacterium]